MNVQIFYLKNQEQEDLHKKLVRLLKEHVFEDEYILIEHGAISEDYNKGSKEEEHKDARSYMNLLKVSMIMTGDIIIDVSDGRGGHCYMGYWEEGLNILELSHKSMTSAFPAVAVMDRMVMLPKGIHEALSGSDKFLWLLKPLEVGGLVLVDFSNLESVREGAQQVGIWLKTEIGKLCRRQMLALKSSRPDFEKLATMLEMDKKYFEKHESELLKSMVKLTLKKVSGPVQFEKSSEVAFDIQNESEETELKRVRVLVRAPDTLEPLVTKTLDFPPREAQRIQFEFDAKAQHPICPLQVLFDVSETSQKYPPFSLPLILEVSSPDLTPPGAAPNAPVPRTSRNEDQGESAREKDPRPLLAMPDATLPTVEEAPSPGGSTGGAAAESVTSASRGLRPRDSSGCRSARPRQGVELPVWRAFQVDEVRRFMMLPRRGKREGVATAETR